MGFEKSSNGELSAIESAILENMVSDWINAKSRSGLLVCELSWLKMRSLFAAIIFFYITRKLSVFINKFNP